MIRAIALDIDGTITFHDRQLDISAVDKIRKSEKLGVPICLATGNTLCFTKTVALLLGTSGPLIAEDGGIVYNQSDETEYILGDTKEVVESLKTLKEKFKGIKHTPHSQKRCTDRTLERTIDPEKVTDFLKQKGFNVRAVDSGFAIHLKNLEVNKGNAIKKVAKILGFKLSELAAIGDATNDVEMLEAVGLSFVPSNATQEATDAATHILNKPHGRGVKKAIEIILNEEV